MRLIDADALIKHIRLLSCGEKTCRSFLNSFEDCESCDIDFMVDTIWSYSRHNGVNPERVRHGEWCCTWDRGIYMCSACKKLTDVTEIMGKPAYKFCPWCGADMREVSEDAGSKID